jgi:TatD DNase family protein
MSGQTASLSLYDAHCHLQDRRLRAFLPRVTQELPALGVRGMVVNGTCEEDWPTVLELASEHEFIIPSLGLHPWFIKERTSAWIATLQNAVRSSHCAIGEIGLDRWIGGFDSADQEKVFIEQLALGAELNRPVSIHCLRAWGRLLEILTTENRPKTGFLLHSYGGPPEMVAKFTDLGAYFSFSGYFAHERKTKQRDAFRRVPLERLLIETDAPDMSLPSNLERFKLDGSSGEMLNHPANLVVVYEYLATMLELDSLALAGALQQNFCRLFRPSNHTGLGRSFTV